MYEFVTIRHGKEPLTLYFTDEEEAYRVAERQAKQYPGDRVVLLQRMASVQGVTELRWEM